MMKLHNGFGVKNQGDTAEVFIYGVIGDDWDGVTAKSFADEMRQVTAKNVTVRLNSPGGSVVDGVAMMSVLQRHPANIHVVVDGHSMSAATVVMLGGDSIEATEGSLIMIHDPWTIAIGNAKDLTAEAERLEVIGNQIADLYVARTGMDKGEIRQIMDEERILTAKDALDMGLIDSTNAAAPIAAMSEMCGEMVEKFKAKKFGKILTGVSNMSDETSEVEAVEASEIEAEVETEVQAEVETEVEAVADVEVSDEAVEVEEAAPELSEAQAAADFERQRMSALRAAFPKDPAFAMDAFEGGKSVAAAKAEYADVLEGKLEAAEKKLSDVQAKLSDADGIEALAVVGGQEEPMETGYTDDAESDWQNNVGGCQDKYHNKTIFMQYRNA